ncbi:MAG: hypothetical protein WKF92_11760 [Pyrinomonadaceae bacterium]
MSQYVFSEFRANELESLSRELSRVFDIQQPHLQSIYDTMRAQFEVDDFTPQYLPRSVFRSDDLAFQKSYNEALVIGIDIPGILEKNDGIWDKKTIVVLGQDPLRKSISRVEEIGIGTPYSLHQKRDRDQKSNPIYFDFIKILLDEGYRVYLTDIFKIWVSEPSKDQCIPLSNQDHNRFIQVLKAELKVFAPLAVITWGLKASNIITTLDINMRHLEFPHPSRAANGKWKELMGTSPTRENKVAFWRQTVSDYLASID